MELSSFATLIGAPCPAQPELRSAEVLGTHGSSVVTLGPAPQCVVCLGYSRGMMRGRCGCVVCRRCVYQELDGVAAQRCPACRGVLYPLSQDAELVQSERDVEVACRFHGAFSPYKSSCDFVCRGLDALEAHEGQCKLQGGCDAAVAREVSGRQFRFWEGDWGVSGKAGKNAAQAPRIARLEHRESLASGIAQRLFSLSSASELQLVNIPTQQSPVGIRVIAEALSLEEAWDFTEAASSVAGGEEVQKARQAEAASEAASEAERGNARKPNVQVVLFWQPGVDSAALNQITAAVHIQQPDGAVQQFQLFPPSPARFEASREIYRFQARLDVRQPGRYIVDARVGVTVKGSTQVLTARHCLTRVVAQTCAALEERANVSDLLRRDDEALSLFAAGLQMGADIVSRGVEGIVQFSQYQAQVKQMGGLPQGVQGVQGGSRTTSVTAASKTLGHNALTMESSSSSSLVNRKEGSRGDGNSEEGSGEGSSYDEDGPGSFTSGEKGGQSVSGGVSGGFGGGQARLQFRYHAEELNLGDLNSLLTYGGVSVTVRDAVAFLVGMRGLCFTASNARLFACGSCLDVVCQVLDRFPRVYIVQKSGLDLLRELLAKGTDLQAMQVKCPGVLGRVRRAKDAFPDSAEVQEFIDFLAGLGAAAGARQEQ